MGTVPFNYQLGNEITRENIIRIVFQNQNRKGFLFRDQKRRRSKGFAPYGVPVAMALYNLGSGTGNTDESHAPRPQRGQAGARGTFNKTRN